MEIYYIPLDETYCIISAHDISSDMRISMGYDHLGITGYSALITHEEFECHSPVVYEQIKTHFMNDDIKNICMTIDDDDVDEFLIYGVAVSNEKAPRILLNNEEIYTLVSADYDVDDIIVSYLNMCYVFRHNTVVVDESTLATLQLQNDIIINNRLSYKHKIFDVLLDLCEYGKCISTIEGNINITIMVGNFNGLVYLIDGCVFENDFVRWKSSNFIMLHPSIMLLFSRYIDLKCSRVTMHTIYDPSINSCNVSSYMGHNLKLQQCMVEYLC